MNELKSLVDIVSKVKTRQIEIIGSASKSTSMAQRLYEDLLNDRFNNEAEAKMKFFPKKKNQDFYFNRLKRRLRDRLINTLFFIDVNQTGLIEKQRVYQSCLRDSVAIKLLLTKGARHVAIPLAEKTVRKAEKFEFTEVILSISNDLRTHYATIIGDKKKFKKYDTIIDRYQKIQLAEFKAEEYYSKLAYHYVYSRASKFNLINISEKYAKELKEQLSKVESFKLTFITYLVLTIQYEIVNDYPNTLKTCIKALKYFETKEHLVSKNTVFTFTFKMIAAFIHLKQYEEAEKQAINCLNLMPEGVNNWYIALDYYILVAFHAKKFQKAFEIYLKGISNPKFKNQYQYVSERWIIHGAFIQYLIRCKKVKPDTNDFQIAKKFRLNKFLNEVPAYSKDKRGTNITILILHILFLLEQKKYGEIIDRVESLKTYSQRYLRQDDTFRSNCFIKMLLQLPAASFHKKGVIRKAKKYWDKLLSVPLEEANQSSELEFIPYETLWEFVLDSLDNKFH